MPQIHKLADVHSEDIGENTTVWQYAVILKDAIIGDNCNINCHTFIENDVVIGDNVTLKSGVYLWDGIRIENNVFIGPCVSFTNDLMPRSKKRVEFKKTHLKKGASIGANCSILAGVSIGEYAMIGMGTIITKDVPDYALVYGCPSEIKGWVDENGDKLKLVGSELWLSNTGQYYKQNNLRLIKQ